LKGVGLFTILAGAGRIWKATIDPRTIPNPLYANATYSVDWIAMDQQFESQMFKFLPSFTDFVKQMEKEGRVSDDGVITWPPNMGDCIAKVSHEVRDVDQIIRMPKVLVEQSLLHIPTT